MQESGITGQSSGVTVQNSGVKVQYTEGLCKLSDICNSNNNDTLH